MCGAAITALSSAPEVFTGRMRLAARMGTKVINTNAAARANEGRFFQHIGPLAKLAEELDLVIGLGGTGCFRLL
jgi:hypothetical protein